MSESDKGATMVFAQVAGVWVSGSVQNQSGDVLTIKLVTGSTIHRMQTEIRDTSPRLDDPSEWPL